MTTNLGELLRRKLDADKKKEEKMHVHPMTVVRTTNGDHDYVAVVLTHECGGWFTRHGIEDLLYDPYIVHMVQEKESYMEEDYDRLGWTVDEKSKWESEVISYCRKNYPGHPNYAFDFALALSICWVRVGRRFVVLYDQDGERLMFEDTVGWLDAGRRSV